MSSVDGEDCVKEDERSLLRTSETSRIGSREGFSRRGTMVGSEVVLRIPPFSMPFSCNSTYIKQSPTKTLMFPSDWTIITYFSSFFLNFLFN